MNPTLNKSFTVIINSDNKEEMNAKKQSKEIRISQNSIVAKMSERQTDQGNPLSDTEEHLTEGSQLSRAHSAEFEDFAEINTDKSDLLDTETFHGLICSKFLYSAAV